MHIQFKSCPDWGAAVRAESLAASERAAVAKSPLPLHDRIKLYDQISAAYGLDPQTLEHQSVQNLELPSHINPDHPWRIGRFTTTSITHDITGELLTLGLPSLSDAFERKAGEVGVKLSSPQYVRAQLERLLYLYTSQSSPYHTFRIDLPSTTDAGLISLAGANKAAIDAEDTRQGYYITRQGAFFRPPLHIVGISPVRPVSPMITTERGLMITHVSSDLTRWFTEALQIALETVDYVLAQPDPSHFTLQWLE